MTPRERYRWAALCSFTSFLCCHAVMLAYARQQAAWLLIFLAAAASLSTIAAKLAHGDERAERQRKKIKT